MRRTALALGIAALVAPVAASANTGVGLLVMAVPITIIGLIPAILVEAPILSRVLQLPGLRGLWISCIANVVSTIVGFVVALVTSFVPVMYGEFIRETVLISLVPMFFLTWWIENLVVRRMVVAEKKPLAKRATGIANAFSYVAMMVCVAILVPSESTVFNRWRLGPALNELGIAKNDVAEDFRIKGAFPAPKSFTPVDKSVKSLVLEPGGRIVATLSFPGRPAGDGRHIVYEPVVIGGKLTGWKCSSDIDNKYLPAACR